MSVSREWLASSVTLLSKLIKLDSAKVVIADSLGLLVARAREKYGRELIDQKINEHQQRFDARKAGICTDCLRDPAIGGDGGYSCLCTRCKKGLEEFNRKMDILEAMEQDPINKTPS